MNVDLSIRMSQSERNVTKICNYMEYCFYYFPVTLSLG